MPVLDARTIQPQPFPYKLRSHSQWTIEDADGFAVFAMSSGNQQAIATRDFILDSINFLTEAEALAMTDVRVAKALAELREAVEATKVEGICNRCSGTGETQDYEECSYCTKGAA